MKTEEILKKQGELYKNLSNNKTIQEYTIQDCNEKIEKAKQKAEQEKTLKELVENSKNVKAKKNISLAFLASSGGVTGVGVYMIWRVLIQAFAANVFMVFAGIPCLSAGAFGLCKSIVMYNYFAKRYKKYKEDINAYTQKNNI